jgi:L-arabinose isomerase
MGDRTAMTGDWLAHCAACPVPEIANVFNRCGITFHQVTGLLGDDPVCWNEVDAWIEAARVANIMFHNRLGLMGHYYSGMLDIYTDLTQQCAYFGGHMELMEVDELAKLREGVSEQQIRQRVAHFRKSLTCNPIARRKNWLARLAHRWRWINSSKAARSGFDGVLLHGDGKRGE